MDERAAAVDLLTSRPVDFAHAMGFTLLRDDLHGEWIRDILEDNGQDVTKQAHRGSYKTTAVSVAIAELMILEPNLKMAFLRKTDDDVKEVVAQIRKLLENPVTGELVRIIWGVQLKLTKAGAAELSTNLTDDPRGASQLLGMGVGGSLTGKHFDRIFTDDIVNLKDRFSRAERDQTKRIYQELQNVKNRGGRIINTGTPWHIDDAFAIMPPAERWDCYQTGLIPKPELEEIRSKMEPSLFAANYELRHIASDDVLFFSPATDADPALVRNGITHIDAAYGGDDYTAFTACRKIGQTYYILGKLWHRHVDDCKADIKRIRAEIMAGRGYCEDNGDKGYLARDLRRDGENFLTYHEKMNKHLKITTYLKGAWSDVVFVKGTDQAYIDQICDYTENAEHDDAPDSASSAVRLLWKA